MFVNATVLVLQMQYNETRFMVFAFDDSCAWTLTPSYTCRRENPSWLVSSFNLILFQLMHLLVIDVLVFNEMNIFRLVFCLSPIFSTAIPRFLRNSFKWQRNGLAYYFFFTKMMATTIRRRVFALFEFFTIVFFFYSFCRQRKILPVINSLLVYFLFLSFIRKQN